jgi:beta-mannosidase
MTIFTVNLLGLSNPTYFYSTMKKIFVYLLFPMVSQAQPNYLPLRQSITTAWQFKQSDLQDWLPTTLPSSVHTALLKNGKIEDPYYRTNESDAQWIESKNWDYQTTFDVDSDVFAKNHIELHFKGIDTYATIFLNDSLLLETNNMFRSWKVEVKKWLKPSGNVLHIHFDSPTNKVKADWEKLGYQLPGGIRTMTRKAQFHYGWDWGPKLVGCGILKTPEIIAWNDLIIENVFVVTRSLTPEKAKMVALIRYNSDFRGPVSLISRDGKRKSIEDRIFEKGVHNDSISFEVANPKLWWCNGLGEPNLYDFTFEIKYGVKTLDKKEVRTGIRTIELVKEKDKPVFARGANYIPQDLFQDRIPPSHYQSLLTDVAKSNMNMLRVWGGGIYEDDLFYQLCDAKGIMVWQDFMYACALYPGSGKFLKTAAIEALEQIERLRQHPCLALWCGNNENNEAWHNWGWQMNFTESQRKQLWRDYQILFSDLLPTYVNNNGGGVPYWESSPAFSRFNSKSLKEGDAHYWGVWHDEEPFEIFDKKIPRFMSEFGFQSFPEWKTIESFTLPEDRKLDSPVMLAHQKHPRGNALIAEYLQRDHKPPQTFEDLVYLSQILQGEGIRKGLEAHRRNKPYCMGTLYWQLNDVWQGASWSSRDYFGRWKALQYFTKEAFSPIALLPIIQDDTLKIFAVDDTRDTNVVNLSIHARTLDGKSLYQASIRDLTLSNNNSMLLWEGATKTLLNKVKADNCVIECILTNTKGDTIHRKLTYLLPPKKLRLLNPKLQTTVTKKEQTFEISISSDLLAKNVMLQANTPGHFSDNYFDILPNETKIVTLTLPDITKVENLEIKTKQLTDTWRK